MKTPTLEELGFREHTTVETIATTYTPRGNCAAAPLGAIVTSIRRGELTVSPFTTTYTYRNLLSAKAAVLNVTWDPLLFLHTTFKETNPTRRLPPNWFQPAVAVSAPALKAADAHVEVSVKDSHIVGNRATVQCRVQHIQAHRIHPRVYSRAAPALIESIIHATRVKAFHAQGDEQAVRGLLNLLSHYRSLIARVAPESAYSRAAEDLSVLMKSWGVKV